MKWYKLVYIMSAYAYARNPFVYDIPPLPQQPVVAHVQQKPKDKNSWKVISNDSDNMVVQTDDGQTRKISLEKISPST